VIEDDKVGMMEQQKTAYKNDRFVCSALFCIAFFLMIWRCFLGFDWSDETHYAALAYRLFLQDPLFLASWEIHQLSGLITLPLVAPYIWLTGSTDGILLFLRITFTMAQACVVLYACKIFAKRIDHFVAICASLLFFAATICVRSFSYNTMTLLFWTLAGLTMIHANSEALHKKRLYSSGLCSAVSVLSYPPTVIVLLVICGYILIIYRRKNHVLLKSYLWFALGGVTIVFVFFMFLCFNSSLSNLIRFSPYLFWNANHDFFAWKSNMLGWGHQIVRLAGGDIPLMVIVIITAISAILSFANTRWNGKAFVVLHFLAILLFGYVLYVNISHAISNHAYFNNPIATPTIFMFFLFFTGRRKWHPSIFLYVIGLVLSFAVGCFTNTSHAFAYPLFLSSFAVIIYLFSAFPIVSKKKLCRASKTVLGLFAGMVLALQFFLVYRDEPVVRLTSQMTSGPAAGIYTTTERSSKYEIVVDTINKYAPEGGRVLYGRLMPFGYLCGNFKPASHSVWRTYINDVRFEEYYRYNPDCYPDMIFMLNEDFQFSPRLSRSDLHWIDYMCAFIDTSGLQKIETECGTIYLFNR